MLDVHRGRMTWRRLRVIIQHLPPESHTMTALRNATPADELERQAGEGEPEKGRWSQAEQLLAAVYDRLGRIEYALIAANTEKKRDRPNPPEPLRRPGAVPRKKKPAAMTEAAAETLFRLINGGAA
ncbi:DUF5361 domain-containing protein [Streptomyces rimosus]|uniref:DUF5361 domain-containing protein n=1 Tax=Streptomyces rimosus TaxID=1927 RepID=UPI000A738407|nr:DUF5361 domain-containing protein [Streptomyces rimosus]